MVKNMPSINGLTTEQKSHRNNTVQCKKIRDILRSYMDGTSVAFLAEIIHVDNQSLNRKFSGDTKWDVATLTKVCEALNVTVEDRARMLGWRA